MLRKERGIWIEAPLDLYWYAGPTRFGERVDEEFEMFCVVLEKLRTSVWPSALSIEDQ